LLSPLMTQSPALAAVALDSEEAAFCTLINNYRATKGLPALMVSESLTNASEWHSTDMANKNYFSHTDSLGRDPFKRMTALGYGYSTYRGENIAAGNATAAATFDQWKNSSGHNANMLNANYKVIGIGKAYNAAAAYRNYWTTDFGGVVDPGAVPCPGSGGTTLPRVTPSVSIADVSLVEGNSRTFATKTMTFTLKASSPSTEAMKVNYSTSNGTALAGSDYTAVVGTATIPAGSTSVKVTMKVVKDRVKEANETFLVNLSTPVNAAIADGLAVGTIVNDD
ncbi:MAG TPA: CAP domain-containing protein, partial [Actinomycetota bacterium]|nr:CAP domain-containing protein [Actinomycetota bacterium]